MAESINTLVIGAGVVGLAVARALADSGRQVVVIERNRTIGLETSSRNSEVIHAGIYYPSGSLKARLCVTGKRQLYEYCRNRHVGHERIGKLIVASDVKQLERLEAIAAQATANGVDDLEPIDAAGLRAFEPAVTGVAALYSPSTGIIDSHALMLALLGDLERAGGQLAIKTEVRGILRERDGGLQLALTSAGARSEIVAREIVNAAGLDAIGTARNLECSLPLPLPRYAKGSYFHFRGKSPFRRLIYPLPVDGGLGIHATLDLAGRLRFGPDVEWIDRIDYSVSASRAHEFATAIGTYWPGIDTARLEPAYAGVRPKIVRNGATLVDFEILHEIRANAALVHLLGIESPGLTSCLAIGEHVRKLLDR